MVVGYSVRCEVFLLSDLCPLSKSVLRILRDSYSEVCFEEIHEEEWSGAATGRMWVRPLEGLLCIYVYVSVLVQHMCHTAGALAYVSNKETKG